jgi:pimeloyl-ACP methyl ester carboxylesterase
VKSAVAKFSVNDLVLEADLAGDLLGPTVVLLHGGGQTRHAWRSTSTALLDAGFATVLLDQRGHGESSWAPDGDYRIDRYADDLEAVLSQLPSRPALVGASLGGLAGLVASARNPSNAPAVGLVLVDVTPTLSDQGGTRIQAFMRAKPQGFESLEELAELVAAYSPRPDRVPDPERLRKNVRQQPDGRYRWHWDPRFLDTIDARTPAGRANQLAAASTLTLPTLLVSGQLSDVVSEDAVREFLELAPHAEYVNVRAAGHMLAGEANDRFTSAVIDFMQRLAWPGEEA